MEMWVDAYPYIKMWVDAHPYMNMWVIQKSYLYLKIRKSILSEMGQTLILLVFVPAISESRDH